MTKPGTQREKLKTKAEECKVRKARKTESV